MGAAATSQIKAGWVVRNFASDENFTNEKLNSQQHLNLKETSDLEVHTDVIVAVGRQPISENVREFKESIQAQEVIEIVVYSLRDHDFREITIKNEKSESGHSLKLGLTIQYDTIENLEKNVLHVLSVDSKGPGEIAGLIAGEDFIVYHPTELQTDSVDIMKYIAKNDGREIMLVVFNSTRKSFRVVKVMPDSKWGGNGSIGCEIAIGLTHGLPRREKVEEKTDEGSIVSKISAKVENPELLVKCKPDYNDLLAQYKFHYESAKFLEQQLSKLTSQPKILHAQPSIQPQIQTAHLQNSVYAINNCGNDDPIFFKNAGNQSTVYGINCHDNNNDDKNDGTNKDVKNYGNNSGQVYGINCHSNFSSNDPIPAKAENSRPIYGLNYHQQNNRIEAKNCDINPNAVYGTGIACHGNVIYGQNAASQIYGTNNQADSNNLELPICIMNQHEPQNNSSNNNAEIRMENAQNTHQNVANFNYDGLKEPTNVPPENLIPLIPKSDNLPLQEMNFENKASYNQNVEALDKKEVPQDLIRNESNDQKTADKKIKIKTLPEDDLYLEFQKNFPWFSGHKTPKSEMSVYPIRSDSVLYDD